MTPTSTAATITQSLSQQHLTTRAQHRLWPRWNLKKAEWEKFSELCNNIQLEHEENSNQCISDITQAIFTAATQTIPKTKPPRNRPSVPWWSLEIRRAIAKRKRAFKAYFRNRTEENLIIRNRERAKTQRIIRTAKRTSWQLYISKLTSSTPLSQIWQMIRRLSGKRTQSSIPILSIPGHNDQISDPIAVKTQLLKDLPNIALIIIIHLDSLNTPRQITTHGQYTSIQITKKITTVYFHFLNCDWLSLPPATPQSALMIYTILSSVTFRFLLWV